MIHAAISHLANQLNQYLKRTCDLTEDMVVISNIVEQDGNMAPNIDNRLVLFLVNIERDTTPYLNSVRKQPTPERMQTNPAPLFVNLHLMIAGSFSGSNYPEGLKFISHTIGFFQRQSLFDHQNTPDLDPRIERLTLEIENLDFQALSHLWGVLTGKYLPSILYKVRLMTFDLEDITGLTPTITAQNASISSMK